MSVVSPPEPPRLDELEALIREARARQRRRWMFGALVVGVGAAVVLGISAAMRGTHTSGPVRTHAAKPAVAARCTLSDLRVRRIGSYAGLDKSGGYYGMWNVGRQACSLKGWPYVVAIKADGRTGTGEQVRETFYGPFKAPRRPPTINLEPGATAAFALTTGDSPLGNARTCPAPYTRLRIGLTRGGRHSSLSAWIPYLGNYFRACTRFEVSEIVPRSDLRG
jgi:Protein of unknown function (DUF4232)